MAKTTKTFGHLLLAALLAGCGGVTTGINGDGGTADSPEGSPPHSGCGTATSHRPSAVACSMTRPAGGGVTGFDGGFDDAGPGSPCQSDSECRDAGPNTRCTPGRGLAVCEADGCFSDGDCGKGAVCTCGGPAGTGRYPNSCLPGNCQVDSDCGECGYCSPSYGTCGSFGGVTGYFCHTSHDTCTNDDDCNDGGQGYCAYQPMLGAWSCSYAICTG